MHRVIVIIILNFLDPSNEFTNGFLRFHHLELILYNSHASSALSKALAADAASSRIAVEKL
jgi:hypothetical protein